MKYLIFFSLFFFTVYLKAGSQEYERKLIKDATSILKSSNPLTSLYIYLDVNKDELEKNGVTFGQNLEDRLEDFVTKIFLEESFEHPRWDKDKKCYFHENQLGRNFLELTGLKLYHPNGWFVVGHPRTVVSKNSHLFNPERDTDHEDRDENMWSDVPDCDYNLMYQIMKRYGDPKYFKTSRGYGSLLSETFISHELFDENRIELIANTLGLSKDQNRNKRLSMVLNSIFWELEENGNYKRLSLIKEQLLNTYTSNLCPIIPIT